MATKTDYGALTGLLDDDGKPLLRDAPTDTFQAWRADRLKKKQETRARTAPARTAKANRKRAAEHFEHASAIASETRQLKVAQQYATDHTTPPAQRERWSRIAAQHTQTIEKHTQAVAKLAAKLPPKPPATAPAKLPQGYAMVFGKLRKITAGKPRTGIAKLKR